MAILELKEIKKEYKKGEQKVYALRGVDITIEKGEFLSIIGPSGSGKTTLLNIIGCLDSPTSGTVIYNSQQLAGLKEKGLSRYRKQNIGFIFQSFNLIPVLSVKENVELPMVIEKKWSKREIGKKALDILKAVGLAAMADRLPREISGGQEQRVAIARALVKNPLIILADEPTANLDSSTAEDIIALMEQINEEYRTTFIFSTHDPLMQKHAKRIVVLKDGTVSSDERNSL
jgi:putative ABC transport system ATP-binding protein